MIQRLLGIVVLFSVMTSCSSDLDVTAPYKENTVVYALLDADSSMNFVKINKAFLGDGNAYQYALIPDSSEYTDTQLDAQIKEVINGVTVDSFPLKDTLLAHDLGIFAGPQHKLYYFNAPLSEDAAYRIEVTAKGNTVSSSTPVVGQMGISSNQALQLMTIVGTYANTKVKWSSAKNGKRYEVSYRFRWDEVNNGDTVPKSFIQGIGTVVALELGSGKAMEVELSGQSVFQTIGLRVTPDPNVSQRIFRGIDLMWAIAGSELHNYLQLNSPISGIVEDRPTYTNVENGYGLFSSRRFREQTKTLGATTVAELVAGQYTGALQFCVPNSSPPYGCP